MTKIATSKKQKPFSMNDAPIGRLKPGIKSEPYSPKENLRNSEKIREALLECMRDGDTDAFREILTAHVRAVGIQEVTHRTKLGRSTIYSAIGEDANPTIETVFQILKTGT